MSESVRALPLSSVIDYLVFLPQYYLRSVSALLGFTVQHPHLLAEGLVFSAALLTILTAHEMGHYLACRRYGVAATLPFFIPAPPLFLAGTFGAFIKIKSPIPSRRALFDITCRPLSGLCGGGTDRVGGRLEHAASGAGWWLWNRIS